MTTVTIDRAVLEQVVEALDSAVEVWDAPWVVNASTALREALNAPSNDALVSNDAGQAAKVDKPEPVAFYNFQSHELRWAKPTTYAEIVAVDVPELPLYAAPPQLAKREWVGLTDEQISRLLIERFYSDGSALSDFVRAIEAALKERNHE